MTRLRGTANRTFRSMRIRNFRVFFLGQLVSMTGSWMQIVAQGWLVLRLSDNSGSALGVVTALQFLPVLVLGAWSGVIADRFDKRKVLTVTQSVLALLSALLAVLTITGVVELWMVYVISFATGFSTSFDNPARQAFTSELVGPDDLANAISLNSAMFNLARILGPAVAGVAIGIVDIGPCFAFNAVSFLAVILSLRLMRSEELLQRPPVMRAKGQVREGLVYVWHNPVLRSTLLLMAVVGTLGFNFQVVIPLLAKVSFNGGPGTYGLLSSLMGAGALVGALAIASRHRPTRVMLLVSCMSFGGFMLAIAAAPSLAVAMPLFVLMGVSSIAFMSTANATLQLTADPSMRGRVMALHTLVFLGSTPIGGPIVGFVSEHFGPRFGLGLGGAATLLGAVASAFVLLRTRRIAARVEAMGPPAEVASEPAVA